jgi:integrase
VTPALRLFTEEPANSPPPIGTAQVTVKQVIEWYAINNPSAIRSSAADKERRRIWSLFIAKFGTRLVSQCRAFELVEFINRQPRIKSNWARRRWAITIKRPFNFAARLGIIPTSPFAGASFPEGTNGRDWSNEEFRAMLKAATPEYRRLLVAIRFSGMRPGEVRQLEWPDVREAIVIDGERTKTKLARKIPLNSVLVKLFTWLRRRSKSSYVFVNSFGGQWQTNAMTKRLRELRRRVGLSEKVKLHGGRHMFATRAIMNGTDVTVLAQLLGHKTIKTTEIYVHMADKTAHLAAAMESAIRGESARGRGSVAEKARPPG